MLASRLVAVDRVKACAIIAVVITHAGPDPTSPAWTMTDQVIRGRWWLLFHVPAFLVMAGLLYRTDRPWSWNDVWHRIARVLIPYLVVLSLLYLTGMAPWPGWAGLPFAVVTAESYGIFYFVPVLLVCVLFGWLLSRLPARAITALAVALLTCGMVAAWLLTPLPFFWSIRDPLGRYYLVFFALGWLGVPARIAQWPRPALALAALAVLALWVWFGVPSPWPLRIVPLRVIYTLAIVGLLWPATWTFPGMRFSSEASLGIYLMHRPLMDLVAPFFDPQPPLLRIAGLVLVGLGGAALICALARATLGPETARRWLGV